MMIEVDYRKMTGRPGWYKNNGFGIVVQRGAYKNNKTGVPMVWLPFSVDPKEFYPDPNITRKGMIGFVGSYMSRAYTQRKNAISALNKNKLLYMHKKKIKKPIQYAEFVRSTVGFLDSAEYHTPHGKVWEVMSSGTVLLCPQFLHDRILFGKEQCYVPYHPSCKNVVAQAKKIINNKEWSQNIANNGREAVLKSHTHEHRIQELWEIIERFMNGNSQPRKWGI